MMSQMKQKSMKYGLKYLQYTTFGRGDLTPHLVIDGMGKGRATERFRNINQFAKRPSVVVSFWRL